MRNFFLSTQRIGFSKWESGDIELAALLWGDADVTRFICASGKFSSADIAARLDTEIQNNKQHGIQYWPFFDLKTGDIIGCCGLRPYKNETHSYEIGFHLRKKYWGQGFASEATNAVINYSFDVLCADKLYAGHHPQNAASKKLLTKLGFDCIGEVFYQPTGLYHPSYELKRANS